MQIRSGILTVAGHVCHGINRSWLSRHRRTRAPLFESPEIRHAAIGHTFDTRLPFCGLAEVAVLAGLDERP
ncbi:hypothetical protein A0H81_13739 [Grifola frondosa]|uniref:Uncharacterized protein n=1 Tax=Grifola frondosa TaxID=5627 RepID=A0A1C7LMZ0_GRIFR|nr:hypothetical protein A0H81_13739 [Grifola frondosa]